VATPTQTQLDTARKTCAQGAKKAFKNAGGDEVEFGAEQKKGIAEMVGKQLEACNAATGKVDKACKDQAKKLMKKLGAPEQKFDRVKQDGVRDEIATFIEACSADAADDTAKKACITEAKGKYKELSGESGTNADKNFEKEKRKGAGRIASASKKACLQSANLDKTGVDACETAAKASHKNAGGDAKSYWYDAKKGLLRDALDYFEACKETDGETDATCTSKAETYFTTTLKGDMGDWSEEDFKERVKNLLKRVTTKASKKIDVRFRFKPNAGEKIGDKEALTKAKAGIEKAVKDKAAAATVQCNDATHSGSKIDMVCRIAAADATAAAVIETAVRADETYAIAAAAATKTATVRGRVLADVESSTDASQVQSDVLETVDEVKDGIDNGGEMADVAGNSATSVSTSASLMLLALTSIFIATSSF